MPSAQRWCSDAALASAMLPPMYGQIVIVGAGQAADQAAHTLRRKGFTGKDRKSTRLNSSHSSSSYAVSCLKKKLLDASFRSLQQFRPAVSRRTAPPVHARGHRLSGSESLLKKGATAVLTRQVLHATRRGVH